MADFSYTLGGSPIPSLVGKVSTEGFDYTLGGSPIDWLTNGVSSQASVGDPISIKLSGTGDNIRIRPFNPAAENDIIIIR